MAIAVFRPVYRRTSERVAHHREDSTYLWHEIEFVPVLTLKGNTIESAMAEAKDAGYVAPVLGEVA